MVGTLNKFQKFYKGMTEGMNSSGHGGVFNPFWTPPAYQDKFRDALNTIKPIATVASTIASFIPVVGTAVSAGITGAMTIAEMADKMHELNQSRNWDWSYLYDWENLASDPEAQKTLMDVMSGTYNGDPAIKNASHGDFSGNFHY
jgi:hypothetical protein